MTPCEKLIGSLPELNSYFHLTYIIKSLFRCKALQMSQTLSFSLVGNEYQSVTFEDSEKVLKNRYVRVLKKGERKNRKNIKE